ncbi:MAG: hypothetical protein BGO31_06750 [Bacteroidetes bacterium 43-16]|nr:MAG: hypothetical protein BGO31_06750 [Bacteroidetes bacterium 43-16]
MNKIITLFIAFIAVLGLNSCQKVIGQGPVVTEERNVDAFTRIESEFPGEVILVQGAVQLVKAQAQENIMKDLQTTVSNGVLKIKIKNGLRLSTGSSLKVYVTIPVIERLSLMGSGNLVADDIVSEDIDLKLTGSGDMHIGNLECSSLYSELTGSGSMTISGGNAPELKVRLTGSGDLKAQNLSAVDADVRVTGSGSATVRASRTLNATISGSGNINYYGNPSVTQSVTGSGKVKRKD